MANLRIRASKEKDIVVVGRFVKADGRCKKHPKHRQSPGVCSLCLSDKLSQVLLSAASSSSSKTTSDINRSSYCSSSASSLSSYYSSSSASSCASPTLHRDHPFPLTAEGKRSSSVSIFLLSAKHGLVKSRSMAVVPRRSDHRGAEGGVDKKKRGFWSKLLRPNRSKRTEEKVVRSRSFRETVTAAN